MEDINILFLRGRVASGVKLSHTMKEGMAVTTLGLAVNNRDSSGRRRDRNIFIDVKAAGQVAENCAKLKKGDPIFILGRLEASRLKSAKGESVTRHYVVAEMIRFL